jgi:hypothetical protein
MNKRQRAAKLRRAKAHREASGRKARDVLREAGEAGAVGVIESDAAYDALTAELEEAAKSAAPGEMPAVVLNRRDGDPRRALFVVWLSDGIRDATAKPAVPGEVSQGEVSPGSSDAAHVDESGLAPTESKPGVEG